MGEGFAQTYSEAEIRGRALVAENGELERVEKVRAAAEFRRTVGRRVGEARAAAHAALCAFDVEVASACVGTLVRPASPLSASRPVRCALLMPHGQSRVILSLR